MTTKLASGWQFVLADLSLILFLLTLSALAGFDEIEPGQPSRQRQDAIAPSQALYRSSNNGPSIEEWLERQPLDHRATLTIFADYADSDRDVIWHDARALANEAEARGVNVRVIVRRAQTSDLYASLAYDQPSIAAAP